MDNNISIPEIQSPPSWDLADFCWREPDKEIKINRLNSLIFASCYFAASRQGAARGSSEERCSATTAWPEMLWTQNRLGTCRRRIYICSLIFQIAMKLHPGLRNKATMPSCPALTCLFYGTQGFYFERRSFKHSLSHGFKCLAQDSQKSSLF